MPSCTVPVATNVLLLVLLQHYFSVSVSLSCLRGLRGILQIFKIPYCIWVLLCDFCSPERSTRLWGLGVAWCLQDPAALQSWKWGRLESFSDQSFCFIHFLLCVHVEMSQCWCDNNTNHPSECCEAFHFLGTSETCPMWTPFYCISATVILFQGQTGQVRPWLQLPCTILGFQ